MFETMRQLYFLAATASALSLCAPVMAEPSMPVSVVRSVRATIAEEVSLTGNLQARRVSLLSAEVDGLVARLSVDEGDHVFLQQVVLSLDDELSVIAQARALAEVEEASARHTEAERLYGDLTELAKRQHVPKTNVESARAEIQFAQAALKQAQSDQRRAQALLKRHTVHAPFDGVVTRKLVEVGQWVETSSALIELVETRFLRLEAPVPQFYFTRVQPGTRVAIRFDSLPKQIFEAAITTTIPVSDSAARTFPIRIDLANEQGLLAPGMSARVILQLDSEAGEKALMVPQDAIVRRPDGTETLWTIEIEDGITKAAPRVVRTGRVYHNNVEILSDNLQPGTQVIVRGNEILRPGQAVTVAEEMPMEI
jgi:membrane fusion protein (multidrug efflux system)